MEEDERLKRPITFEELEQQVFEIENRLWIADRRADAAYRVLGSLILNLGRPGAFDAHGFLRSQLDAAVQLGGSDAATSQYLSELLQQLSAKPAKGDPSGLH